MFCSHCGGENPDNAKYCAGCGVILKDPVIPCGSFLDKGRYEVKRLLKAGGMGAVYLAFDNRLGLQHALKEMIDFSPTPQERNKSVERFKNEAALLAALAHPSLPRVSNYFVEGGHYYMVMDYIEGEDLETILKREGRPGLSEKLVKLVGIEICKVLDYLHHYNPPVLNRDIKPSNIMMNMKSKQVYLVDFGIAKTIAPSSYKKTAIGTEGYAPLEQYRGYPEPRSDIFALGATMYRLLTGAEIKPLDFPPIRDIHSDISVQMENILLKALNMYPEGRFADAGEMRQALENVIKTTVKRVPVYTKYRDPARALRDLASPTEGILDRLIEVTGHKRRAYKCSFIRHAKDGMEMAFVEGGNFIMGTPIDDEYASFASRDEMPVHTIAIAPFYMDIHPVTNRQFLRFVEETGYETTADLRGDLETWKTYFTYGKDNHPVVYVSWYDAKEYAAWAGKYLPTEAEWEKASRGIDGSIWPWGDHFDPGMLNCNESGIGSTTEVMQFRDGKSPYGLHDMAGNVREWTSDWYRPYPYEGPYSTGYLKSIRGGSYEDRGIDNRCAKRWENAPSHRDRLKGFRCVKTA